MTDRAALLRLRDRLKVATGPDRELDEQIAIAFGWKWVGLSPRYWLEPGMDIKAFQNKPNTLDPRVHLATPISFTRSTDAAMTLALPEWVSWVLGKGRTQPSEPAYGVLFFTDELGADEVAAAEHNDSLAICICLARVQHEINKTIPADVRKLNERNAPE